MCSRHPNPGRGGCLGGGQRWPVLLTSCQAFGSQDCLNWCQTFKSRCLLGWCLSFFAWCQCQLCCSGIVFFAVIYSRAVGAWGHCAGANLAGQCPSGCASLKSLRALQKSIQNCPDSSLASLASCYILVSGQKNWGSCHADLRSKLSSVCLQIHIKLFYNALVIPCVLHDSSNIPRFSAPQRRLF